MADVIRRHCVSLHPNLFRNSQAKFKLDIYKIADNKSALIKIMAVCINVDTNQNSYRVQPMTMNTVTWILKMIAM